MKNTIRYLWARLRTRVMRSQIRRAHKTGKASALLMWAAGVTEFGPSAWWSAENLAHPYNDRAVKNFRWAVEAGQTDGRAVMFMDSLGDIPRDDYESVPSELNFSLSGQTTGGFRKLINGVQLTADISKVSAVILPSFGNNGFSAPPADRMGEQMVEAMRDGRRIFSGARLVLPEIPPTYSVPLQLLRLQMAALTRKFALMDRDAVVISFEKFGAAEPSTELSSDGVHFTPAAVVRFDQAIQEALKAPAGSVVYA